MAVIRSGPWAQRWGPISPAWGGAIARATSGSGCGRRWKEPTPGGRMPELEPAERDVSRLLRHMPTPKLDRFETEALAAYLASLRSAARGSSRGEGRCRDWIHRVVPGYRSRGCPAGRRQERLARRDVPRADAGGIRVPNGFAVTAEAYRALPASRRAGRRDRARSSPGLDTARTSPPWPSAAAVRERSWPHRCPTTSARDREAYANSAREVRAGSDVAVRSQRDRRGPARGELRRPAGVVPEHPRRAGAARRLPALLRLAVHRPGHLYRATRASTTSRSRLSVGVQKMVAPTWAPPGVLFTLDHRERLPGRGARSTAPTAWARAWSRARVDPDEFCVFKPTLRSGLPADPQATARAEGRGSWSTTRAGRGTPRSVPVPAEDATRLSLTRRRGARRWRAGAARSRSTTRRKAGRPTPMDIEWAQGRHDGRAVHPPGPARDGPRAAERRPSLEVFTLAATQGPSVLVTGRSVGEKIGAGRVRRRPGSSGPRRLPARRGAGPPT